MLVYQRVLQHHLVRKTVFNRPWTDHVFFPWPPKISRHHNHLRWCGYEKSWAPKIWNWAKSPWSPARDDFPEPGASGQIVFFKIINRRQFQEWYLVISGNIWYPQHLRYAGRQFFDLQVSCNKKPLRGSLMRWLRDYYILTAFGFLQKSWHEEKPKTCHNLWSSKTLIHPG